MSEGPRAKPDPRCAPTPDAADTFGSMWPPADFYCPPAEVIATESEAMI